MIGWSDKHLNISSFRVDRMTNVEIADLPAAKKPMGWDPEDYCQKVFEMYRGELQIVTLECENEVMKYVIDHFGEDVHTRVTDENTSSLRWRYPSVRTSFPGFSVSPEKSGLFPRPSSETNTWRWRKKC